MELKELGNNIRRVRQERGLTQENVANDLDISLTAYTKIERGETNVSFRRLLQIADYFQIELSRLVSIYPLEEKTPFFKRMEKDLEQIKQDIYFIKLLVLKSQDIQK